jgi:hypothetical protein
MTAGEGVDIGVGGSLDKVFPGIDRVIFLSPELGFRHKAGKGAVP